MSYIDQPPPAHQAVPPAYAAPTGSAVAGYTGEVGKIRSTGICILLAIVTLGIYSLVWFYKTHDEMKRNSGQGIGGLVALILAFFVGIVMPYITSHEVGNLYVRRGQRQPVSAVTGLWYFPGMLILIGPLVWFIKTNGALNAHWRSLGAR
jgi:high-affinity Fe2+/Pb2+ permease